MASAEDDQRECVYPTIYGPPCRPRLCVWQPFIGSEDDAPWRAALAYACVELDDEAERAVCRRLAEHWHGSGPQLVDVVRKLAQ